MIVVKVENWMAMCMFVCVYVCAYNSCMSSMGMYAITDSLYTPSFYALVVCHTY